MYGRMLMATVASLALTVPALAQDQAIPLESEQQASPPVAEPEQPLEDEGAAEGMATEIAPADPATGQMTAAETLPPAGMEFIQVQEDAQFLANDEVIGAEVHNVMDEEVGTIADLVMDEDQKLVGVVLSVGGFLGIGDKWVAVPVDEITFPSDDQPARLRVAVTEEQLGNAPDFITREAVEAREAAEEAARQAAVKQQIPPPATTTQ
jgi:hypothetical protein